MNRHPGGEKHTEKLLKKASLPGSAKILDMGAGDGDTVRLLQKYGYKAAGMDLEPKGPDVWKGDFLKTDFSDASFDGILSQCAFYVSGDIEGAFRESARLLKKGGKLLFSDVWFEKEKELRALLERNGFSLLYLEDMTKIWKEYYIECIWNGTVMPVCPAKKHCRYYAVVAERK